MATTSPFLKQPTALISLEDQFLETREWIEKAAICKYVYFLSKEALRAAPLMDYVLNITAEKKKQILEIIAANPELILVRTKGDVKYPSSKQKKIAVRIRISNLSPLEAAALSGDFHLVNIFRDALPDNLKHQAGLQLDAILSRRDFLLAFKVFQGAYQKFLKECDTQSKAEAKDWKIAHELWEQLGEAQKKVSTFGLQVFCNPVPHKPLPDFTLEPVRACRFEVYDNGWKEVDSDLDSFGVGTDLALYMGVRTSVRTRGGVPIACAAGWADWQGGMSGAGIDFEAVSLLCRVIPEQLGKTKTLLLQYPRATDKKSEPEQSVSSASLGPDMDKEPVRAALS